MFVKNIYYLLYMNIYLPFFIIFIIKTIKPFLRKKLINDVSEDNFIIINSIIATIVISIYFKFNFISSYDAFYNTTIKDKFIYILLAIFSIINIYSFVKIDKEFNNATIILDSFIIIATYLLNSYIKKDRITLIKILGIILIIIGHIII